MKNMTKYMPYGHADRIMSMLAKDGSSRALASSEFAIQDSWKRCVSDYSLDPATVGEAKVFESSQVRERQDRMGSLLEIAEVEMQKLYGRISASGYVILLTDADGVIIKRVCDPSLSTDFRHAGLWLGTDWSEQSHGTNGIGTCLHTNSALTVHLDEHFFANDTALTCSGAPIHDPEGNPIAVLDASAMGNPNAQSHTLALVSQSAQAIEKCHFLHSFSNHLVLRFHSRPEFIGLVDEGLIAFDFNGTIVGTNRQSLDLMGFRDRTQAVGRRVEDIFDTTLDALLGRNNNSDNVLTIRTANRQFFGMLYRMPTRSGNQRLTPCKERRTQVPAQTQDDGPTLSSLAGSNPQLKREVERIQRLVNRGIPLLLQGETGAGKDVLARAIHSASDRSHGPFVAINCSAIPESLIESELFGYKAGAFTGARRGGMKGKIEQSSGGTLFLDEIGDMPLALQTRLLRVLEEQKVTPLGAETPISVDLCIVSATHRDLKQQVQQERFREDLYYRLNGMTIRIPPLRERSDIDDVIITVLRSESYGENITLDSAAFDVLRRYNWPGNIRQLRNVMRAAAGLSQDGVIYLDCLPPDILEADGQEGSLYGTAPLAATTAILPEPQTQPPEDVFEEEEANANPLHEAERRALQDALVAHRWNITNTASSLGMSRSTLYRKMEKHGITAPGT